MLRSSTPAVIRALRQPRRYFLLICLAALVVVMGKLAGHARPAGGTGEIGAGTFQAATWNVASINNNPFEYWVSGAGDTYDRMMTTFARVVERPEAHEDLEVQEVFTEDMFEQLFYEMEHAGWKRLPQAREYYENTLARRKIISGFLRDPTIGEKRLVSMFDRVTNTVATKRGTVYRPTPVNCYTGSMVDVKAWYSAWVRYVFTDSVELPGAGEAKLVREMLVPITQSKYPAITEDEENLSVPLQTLHCAIFDAVLAYVLNTMEPRWEAVRAEMCAKLNFGKHQRTLDILADTYGAHDVVFLQEVSAELVHLAKGHRLSRTHDVVLPSAFNSDRNQNSVALLRKGVWSGASETPLPTPPQGVAPGDLLVFTARYVPTGHAFTLASFHGDTNGLLTIPAVAAVLETAAPGKLLLGLDANAHEAGTKKHLGVAGFADFFVSKDLTSCWGENPNPKNFTTFHARTHLQSQLSKAVPQDQRFVKGDRHPKDFLLWRRADLQLESTAKDNTGSRRYVEDMMFPTLHFPSDHGIVSSVLRVR
eukprot:TRINITY_DN19746_c0_g1_i1.p1 TRINITY_DN19746_c0_g1~~TRINITY_DN19746_c0_g1_i1.p1  ORF type:complete len:536 (+),score=175.84 TRINITY_DN19746_c0_g1_i1:39-1646(+)